MKESLEILDKEHVECSGACCSPQVEKILEEARIDPTYTSSDVATSLDRIRRTMSDRASNSE